MVKGEKLNSVRLAVKTVVVNAGHIHGTKKTELYAVWNVRLIGIDKTSSDVIERCTSRV
jgi:hypothetical protein